MPTRARWALALVLLVPAVVVPMGLDRFTFGKLLVGAVGIGLAFTVAPAGRLSRTVQGLVVAGSVIVVCAALVSASPVTSLWGRAPRYEGVFVLTGYLLAGLAGVRLLGPARSRHAIRFALAVMAWCALL